MSRVETLKRYVIELTESGTELNSNEIYETEFHIHYSSHNIKLFSSNLLYNLAFITR